MEGFVWFLVTVRVLLLQRVLGTPLTRRSHQCPAVKRGRAGRMGGSEEVVPMEWGGGKRVTLGGQMKWGIEAR